MDQLCHCANHRRGERDVVDMGANDGNIDNLLLHALR